MEEVRKAGGEIGKAGVRGRKRSSPLAMFDSVSKGWGGCSMENRTGGGAGAGSGR